MNAAIKVNKDTSGFELVPLQIDQFKTDIYICMIMLCPVTTCPLITTSLFLNI